MSETVLVDTDVLLFVAAQKSEGDRFLSVLDGKAWAVSFATAGDVTMHAKRSSKPGADRALARITLGQILHLGCDSEVSRRWGELAASGVSLTPDGRVRHSNDLWTAAVALRYSLRLATNNRKDFEGIPWLRLLP